MSNLGKVVTLKIFSNNNLPNVSMIFHNGREIGRIESDGRPVSYEMGILHDLSGGEMSVESVVLKLNSENNPRIDYQIMYGEDLVENTSGLELHSKGKLFGYSHLENSKMSQFMFRFKFCPRPPWC